MLIGVALLLCLISVPLAGGRVSALAELRFRAGGLAIAAIVLQVAIISVAPAGHHGLHVAVHVASYVLMAAFVGVNRRIPGMALIALGGASNAVAIVANGGLMPASAAAQARAGLNPTHDFINSAAVAHPHLGFLGDVFAVPASVPVHNVFSAGDVVLVVGAAVLLHAAARRARPVPLARPVAS
jgi:hypothetical protein